MCRERGCGVAVAFSRAEGPPPNLHFQPLVDSGPWQGNAAPGGQPHLARVLGLELWR